MIKMSCTGCSQHPNPVTPVKPSPRRAGLPQESRAAPGAAAEQLWMGWERIHRESRHSPALLGKNRVIYEWVGVCILLPAAAASHRKKRLFWLSGGEGEGGAWPGSPHHFQEEGKASEPHFCHRFCQKWGGRGSCFRAPCFPGAVSPPGSTSWSFCPTCPRSSPETAPELLLHPPGFPCWEMPRTPQIPCWAQPESGSRGRAAGAGC